MQWSTSFLAAQRKAGGEPPLPTSLAPPERCLPTLLKQYGLTLANKDTRKDYLPIHQKVVGLYQVTNPAEVRLSDLIPGGA